MTLAAEAKALGVEITAADAAKLQALIDACNGKRKKLRLSYRDALQAAIEASTDPHGIGVRHGGAELLARTTLALAVKTPRGIVVGVAGVFADKPTPGRAWKDLQPWMSDLAKNVTKARAWANQQRADRVAVKVGKPGKVRAPADEGTRLLAAVLADPQDTEARLIYADWLTQQGDPRGELIVLQVELASGRLKGARKGQAAKREKALLRKHGRGWAKEAMQHAKTFAFERGFVGTIEMTGTAWASRGAQLLAREPITTLQIDGVNRNSLVAIANAPHTARLARIESMDSLWLRAAPDAAALTAFLSSKHVGQVRDLDLRIAVVGPVDTSTLFDGVVLPKVERLALGIYQVPEVALASLATIRAPALRELVLGLSRKHAAQLAVLRERFPKAQVR